MKKIKLTRETLMLLTGTQLLIPNALDGSSRCTCVSPRPTCFSDIVC